MPQLEQQLEPQSERPIVPSSLLVLFTACNASSACPLQAAHFVLSLPSALQ